MGPIWDRRGQQYRLAPIENVPVWYPGSHLYSALEHVGLGPVERLFVQTDLIQSEPRIPSSTGPGGSDQSVKFISNTIQEQGISKSFTSLKQKYKVIEIVNN